MNPWFRPSIQTPRRISRVVKFIFSPLTAVVNYGKDFWDTWNLVYRPDETKKMDKKDDTK